MKKILFLSLVLFASVSIYGQVPALSKQYLYYERFSSARDLLNGHLRQHPDDAEAWYLLVKSNLLQDDLAKAADTFRLAPPGVLEQPYGLVARAALQSASGGTESRALIDRAVELTKGKDADLLAAAAESQIITRHGDKYFAVELLQKAIKRDKRNAMLQVLLGNAYRQLQNGGEAYTAYMKAIEKDSHIAAAYYQLGDLFESQKNHELYMDYYTKAIEADRAFAPAYYSIYNHYIYEKPDAAKAMQYFKAYEAASDESLKKDYAYTDLLYLTKQYQQAIANARKLVEQQGEKVQPRLYKLMAYSYAESGDSSAAIDHMKEYFEKEVDSNIIAKDYELMASLHASSPEGTELAANYLLKAAGLSKDSAALYQYYGELANMAAKNQDYISQAKWLGKYYMGNEKASNVDLFNWGVSAYRAKDYQLADTVFAMYTERYPEQGFGYYWRARSNAVIDSTMAEGLAVPHYTKLIEMTNVDSMSETEKKWLLEAYNYLAAYETNVEKDYTAAITYFTRVLEIDPENATAKKYIPILEANARKSDDEGSN